jgi:hypothetical protein
MDRARLDRTRLLEAFRQAAASAEGSVRKGSYFARRAREIYLQGEDQAALGPSYHTFRRLLYGKTADLEIIGLLAPVLKKTAEVPATDSVPPELPQRARLERKRLRDSFRKAVEEMKADLLNGRSKHRHVARRAHEIYLEGSDGSGLTPSVHAFERLVYGKAADPAIAALITSALPDQRVILKAFESALQELADEKGAEFRPRTVAVRAHRIYCAGLSADRVKPSLETFRKLAVGKRVLPEVGEMLKAASVEPTSRAKLDRERLRAVFKEAVQRLEARIFRGQAKPLQVARRAYEIYTREAGNESAKPSRHTFQRLIYGKGADPEILSLLKTALKNED